GQTVIQWHHNSSFRFNKTWAEFRTGFGNRDGDHWIGNEKLFWLTQSRNFSLMITIKPRGGGIRNFNVSKFIVLSENSSFAIRVYDAPGSQSCLSQYNGTQFTTFDRVNSANCAAINGSGWWYNSTCSDCN
ncbi:hypothetical protein LOTGIDRAFT_97085, partial [Lottia gigantea]